jgi:arsenical pump membrane protein
VSLETLRRHWPWALGAAGLLALVAALALRTTDARAAGGQDWPPFVLVSGLLMIGLVSEEDGLFAAAGHTIARRARSGPLLYVCVVILISVVTALLNLDTSVAFLTPVLVYTARSRGEGEAPLLYACLLLSNAGSLILPGSNLTNLIVLGQVHLDGGEFFRRMALPGVASIIVTGAVIALFHGRELRSAAAPSGPVERPRIGVGLAAVIAATVLVLLLSNPALPVLGVGAVAVALRMRPRNAAARRVLDVLGLPVLVGLFGIAVGLGTLGRAWSGPATLLTHLDPWATAAVAALASVLVNNLPAASLLSAQSLTHPFSLLVGLNIGPNLFVTGSLAWVLWLRAAATAKARPSLAAATRLGLISTPLAIAAALAVLSASGTG